MTRFPDVPDDHWAAADIEWAAENGVMVGRDPAQPGGPRLFDPDGKLDRDEAAAVLRRLHDLIVSRTGGDPPPEPEPPPAPDPPAETGVGAPSPTGVAGWDGPVAMLTGRRVELDTGDVLEGADVRNNTGMALLARGSESTPITDVAVRFVTVRTTTDGSEAMRVARNVDGLLLDMADVQGGKNHAFKGHWEDSPHKPRNVRLLRSVFSRFGDPPRGDLVQLERVGGGWEIGWDTFLPPVPENAVDVKCDRETELWLHHCLFDHARGSGAMLLIQTGRPARMDVDDNEFYGNKAIALGRTTSSVTARLRRNLIVPDDDSEWTVILRGCRDVAWEGNIMRGGVIELTAEAQDVTFGPGNDFEDVTLKAARGSTFRLVGENRIVGGSGWPSG